MDACAQVETYGAETQPHSSKTRCMHGTPCLSTVLRDAATCPCTCRPTPCTGWAACSFLFVLNFPTFTWKLPQASQLLARGTLRQQHAPLPVQQRNRHHQHHRQWLAAGRCCAAGCLSRGKCGRLRGACSGRPRGCGGGLCHATLPAPLRYRCCCWSCWRRSTARVCSTLQRGGAGRRCGCGA